MKILRPKQKICLKISLKLQWSNHWQWTSSSSMHHGLVTECMHSFQLEAASKRPPMSPIGKIMLHQLINFTKSEIIVCVLSNVDPSNISCQSTFWNSLTVGRICVMVVVVADRWGSFLYHSNVIHIWYKFITALSRYLCISLLFDFVTKV